MLVNDTKESLKYFDETADNADEEEGPVPCEPRYLYELDYSTMIPQVSQEAINIINAYITGEINPDNWSESYYQSTVVNQEQLKKLFSRKHAPPGFEDIDIPIH
jgi:hypothetical protein